MCRPTGTITTLHVCSTLKLEFQKCKFMVHYLNHLPKPFGCFACLGLNQSRYYFLKNDLRKERHMRRL